MVGRLDSEVRSMSWVRELKDSSLRGFFGTRRGSKAGRGRGQRAVRLVARRLSGGELPMFERTDPSDQGVDFLRRQLLPESGHLHLPGALLAPPCLDGPADLVVLHRPLPLGAGEVVDLPLRAGPGVPLAVETVATGAAGLPEVGHALGPTRLPGRGRVPTLAGALGAQRPGGERIAGERCCGEACDYGARADSLSAVLVHVGSSSRQLRLASTLLCCRTKSAMVAREGARHGVAQGGA